MTATPMSGHQNVYRLRMMLTSAMPPVRAKARTATAMSPKPAMAAGVPGTPRKVVPQPIAVIPNAIIANTSSTDATMSTTTRAGFRLRDSAGDVVMGTD